MSRKGENIYKRKDGRWEGRYIKSRGNSGKLCYGYVYARTYREVKEKLQEAIHFIPPLEVSSDLFANVAQEWFYNTQPYIKISTKNKYYNILNSYILSTYGEHLLSDITYDFIEHHCRQLLVNGGKKGCPQYIKICNKKRESCFL